MVQMANFGPFPALTWCEMVQIELQASILYWNQCCFSEIRTKIDVWGWRWSRWPCLGHFRPHVARGAPDWTPNIHITLGINVALVKFVIILISEAGVGPVCQDRAISGPHVVRGGPDCTPNIHITLGINVALVKFVLKSIPEAGDGPDGHFLAISGAHMVREGPNSHQMFKI